jgi:SAM-dependent methyltransferase
VKARSDVSNRVSFEERWRQRFREFAERHEQDAGIAGWTTSGLRARFRHFERNFRQSQPGGFWIDAGCGAGTYTRFMTTERKLRVVGVDYSLPSVIKAKARSSDDPSWVVADVTRLPFRSATADGIVCFGVTQALHDSSRAVREFTRAIKPGAVVWIDALNAWCLPHFLERLQADVRGRPTHLRHESPARLKAIMRENGLSQIRLYWMPILPAQWQRLQWVVETRFAVYLLRFIYPLGALLSHSFVVKGVRRLGN